MINGLASILAASGADCIKNPFFGLPHWASGLEDKFGNDCAIQDFSLSDIWVIVANVTRMALFLAGLLAVVFVVVGGIMFITSTGNPDQTTRAKKVLSNALIGLVIAIFASTLVGYIARLFS